MKSYDPKQELKLITYLDANTLYDYAMSKFLATSGFTWIDPKEFDLNKYTFKGCVLKVDLDSPKELRELQSDYPLALDQVEIKREMLSEYQYHFNTQKRIEAEKNGDKVGKTLYKLIKNSVYGKTMENLRHRIDVRLVSNKNGLSKMDIQTKLYVTQKI